MGAGIEIRTLLIEQLTLQHGVIKVSYQYILFDLDGTLTDPGVGIINSVRYALKQYGLDGDPKFLRRFIGPPLIDSFIKYYGFDEVKAREAVAYYREYYGPRGSLKTSFIRVFQSSYRPCLNGGRNWP